MTNVVKTKNGQFDKKQISQNSMAFLIGMCSDITLMFMGSYKRPEGVQTPATLVGTSE